MTIDEKKSAIIQALKAGQVSANKLNPASKGKYAGYLVKGKNVSDERINSMYGNLIEITSQSPVETIEAVTGGVTKYNKESVIKEMKVMKDEIDSLKSEVQALKAEIQSLKEYNKECNKLSDTPEYNKEYNKECNKLSDTLAVGSVLHGFNIRRESQIINLTTKDGSTKRLEYPKYYAKKRINGKLHRVYLGEGSQSEAETKIRAYCQKHGLLMESLA